MPEPCDDPKELRDIQDEDFDPGVPASLVCLECGKPFKGMSKARRICDECGRKEIEARARPFIPSSVQKQSRAMRRVAYFFSDEQLERIKREREYDQALRQQRLAALEEKRRLEAQAQRRGEVAEQRKGDACRRTRQSRKNP